MKKRIGLWLKMVLLLSDGIIIAAITVFVLWKLEVVLHPGVLALIAVVLIAFGYLTYKLLWPVIKDRKVCGPDSMVGLEGEVVKLLDPEGVVKIRGELWKAIAVCGHTETGTRVKVIEQEGLTLIVESKTGKNTAEYGT